MEAHEHLRKLADRHRRFAKLYKSVSDRHGEFAAGHESHGHTRLAELHKAMQQDHASIADEHDGYAQGCDDLAECAKSGLTDAAEKIAKRFDDIVPDRVSAIAPSPVRMIPRSGHPFAEQVPSKPNVSIEFEKMFSLADDD